MKPGMLLTVCGVCTGVAVSSAWGAPPAFHDLVSQGAPLLWYQFGEPAGSTATINHGSLGPTFNGVLHNGVTLGVSTPGGDTGASFAAQQTPYVESQSVAPASLTGNPSFTAETVVFIPPSPLVGNYPPFLHWGAPATGRSVYFSLWNTSPNKAFAGFYNGGLRMQCTFRTNEWNHIVWVRDSANGANGQYQGTTVYVNGAVAATEQDTVLPGAPVINVTSTTFTVQRATDRTRYFTGVVDEVVLYDRLLTADEVRAHFNALTIPAFPCSANVNGDCDLNSQDFFDFLTRFFANNEDYNHDGLTNSQDFFDFLSDFFSGCQ